MIGSIKRHREKRAWERRALRQVDELLIQKRQHLELPVAGVPGQRADLVALYRRLLEPLGYRVTELVKNDDLWTAYFEKEGEK